MISINKTFTEAVTWRCFTEKLFKKISQNIKNSVRWSSFFNISGMMLQIY